MIHVSNMAVPTPRRSPQETSFVSRRDPTQLRLGNVPMCLKVYKYTKRLATINLLSKIQIVHKILIVNYHFSGWLVGWSDWGDWSKCEPFAACGQGFKFRHRNCNAPTPDACQGDPVETAMCTPLVPAEQISTGAAPNSSKDFATSISLAI